MVCRAKLKQNYYSTVMAGAYPVIAPSPIFPFLLPPFVVIPRILHLFKERIHRHGAGYQTYTVFIGQQAEGADKTQKNLLSG